MCDQISLSKVPYFNKNQLKPQLYVWSVQVCRQRKYFWSFSCIRAEVDVQQETYDDSTWHVSSNEVCSSKSVFIAGIIEEMCQFSHVPQLPLEVENQEKSIFSSLTLSHRGTQAFLCSNRLTSFLWLWCPFCISSRTTISKRKKRDTSMWVLLNLQQVVHLITTNKGKEDAGSL